MKKSFVLLWFIIATLSVSAQHIKVGTYNIRYANPNDIGNLWKDRAPYVGDLINYHSFDVLGTQEALIEQLKDLDTMLTSYVRYGIGRDDGKTAGEHSAIYYKKDKYTLLDKGDFWLAENPDVPAKGWDATCCNRIATWVKLQDKESGKSFYFFNVHYDHQGKVARLESSKLLIKKMKEIAAEEPIILVGDFNASIDSEPYQLLIKSKLVVDSYTKAVKPYHNNGSTNAFKVSKDKQIIDHIFISPQILVKNWAVLTDTYFGKYPSDHFPVTSELVIP